MLVVRASSCKEGRYGIFLQLYTKVKAQPTWGSLSRSSALAFADFTEVQKVRILTDTRKKNILIKKECNIIGFVFFGNGRKFYLHGSRDGMF